MQLGVLEQLRGAGLQEGLSLTHQEASTGNACIPQSELGRQQMLGMGTKVTGKGLEGGVGRTRTCIAKSVLNRSLLQGSLLIAHIKCYERLFPQHTVTSRRVVNGCRSF